MSQQNNLVGQTLGQYEIVELIGEGGMAAVYKAWQPSLRRYVALKVLSPDLANDAEFVKRFRQEAVSAANLKQTHIVTIHDVGTEDGYHYIAMEFIEGSSLEERIRTGQAFSLEQVIDIVAQVGAALDYAHQRGFIHRDIKPANVLIDVSGRAVLTDFGIVKALGGSGVTSPLTQAGTIFGTPQYMSPEQVKDEPLDHRSDLYSLGVVCYEMLSGQVPFDGTTTHSILYAQVNNPPPPLREFSGLDVPAQVEAVVSKMLSKEREARYGSAGAFARDLAQAVAGVWPAGMGGETAVVGGMGGSTAVIGTPPGMAAPTVRPPAGPPTPPGTAWQPSGPSTPPGTAWPPAGPSTPPGTAWQPSGPSTPPGTVLQPAGPSTPVPAYAPPRRSRWPWVLGGVAAVGVVLVLAAVLVSLLLPDAGNPLEWVGLGNRVERLLEDGQAALDAGNYAEAITTYEQVLEEEADNVEALREIGNAYAAQERWPQAAGWYERWAQVAPDDVEALRGTGDAYAAQEQWQQAAEWYERWAQVAPDDAEALRKVGEAYETQEQWQQAADWYEKWTQVVPDDGTAFLSLGRVCFNLEEYERAVAAYERGKELGADSADVDAHLGLAYFRLASYDKASDYLERGVSQNSEDFLLQRALGLSLFAQNRTEEAIEHLNQAVALGADRSDEELVDMYYALGGCYFEKQDYGQAINFYEQAQELDPERKAEGADEVRANLDEAYVQLGLNVRKDAWLDLGFSDIVTEGDVTYAVAQTGQKARIEGALHLVDGPWEGSRSLLVEVGTMNEALNPRPDGGGIAWDAYRGTSSFEGDPSFPGYGETVARFTATDHGANLKIGQGTNKNWAAEKKIAYAFWAKADADDTYTIQVQGGADVSYAVISDIQDIPVTTSWQRFSGVLTLNGLSTDARVILGKIGQSDVVYVANVSFEYDQDYNTSFVSGDLGPGYAWTGDPHESTSERSATRVDLDDLVSLVGDKSQLSFCVIAQMAYDADAVWPTLSAYLLDIASGSSGDQILLSFAPSGDKFRLHTNGEYRIETTAQTFNAGDWIDLVATLDFTEDEYVLYINGESMGNDNSSLSTPQGFTNWNLGSSTGGANQGGFAFAGFSVFDRPLTAQEVRALYAADAFTGD